MKMNKDDVPRTVTTIYVTQHRLNIMDAYTEHGDNFPTLILDIRGRMVAPDGALSPDTEQGRVVLSMSAIPDMIESLTTYHRLLSEQGYTFTEAE